MKWTLIIVAIIGIVVLIAMHKGKTTTTTGQTSTNAGIGGLLGGLSSLFGKKV